MLLCRDPSITTDNKQASSTNYKTSLVFSLATGPGNLFKALACFSLRDIDMSKIESRPLRTSPITLSQDKGPMQLNYLFYVDILGAMGDERVQNALRQLQEVAPFVRVLGSYQADLEFLRT
jgi:arogenate/prephenate dehydratase